MNVTRREFMLMAGAFTAAASVRGAEPAAAGPPVRVPVLLYHDISDAFRDPYTISPSLFAAQMEWLYGNGFRAIPLRDLADPPADGKAVAITFDDGYASFLEYAFPLFREYRFHSTINVIGALAGKYIHDGDNRPLLSWDEYRHLRRSGLVDIGCHTHALHAFAHKGALGVSEEALRRDLRTFRGTMRGETGTEAEILAWPYGLYDARRTDIAREEGFRYIQTSRNAVFGAAGSLLEIPRINIGNRHDMAGFGAEVAS